MTEGTEAELLKMLKPEWWQKRIALLVAVTASLASALSVLGAQMIWPRDRIDAQGKRIDSVAAVATKAAVRVDTVAIKVDSIDRRSKTTLYLTCELLKRVNPRGAIPPEGC